MITSQRLTYCRTRHFILLLAFLLGSLERGIAQTPNSDLAVAGQALKLITDTANSICYNIDQAGEKSSFKITGEADAKLNNLLSKVADLGVKGAANVQREAHQGVLQNQLETAIAASATCKKGVFDTLQQKLVPGLGQRSEDAQPRMYTATWSRSGDPYLRGTSMGFCSCVQVSLPNVSPYADPGLLSPNETTATFRNQCRLTVTVGLRSSLGYASQPLRPNDEMKINTMSAEDFAYGISGCPM